MPVNLISPSFPNVPLAPGVPQVLRSAVNAVSDISALGELMKSDSDSVKKKAAVQVTWGIYTQNKTLVVAADSIKTFDYKQEWRLPNYPMEKGAFQTYNKVQTPYTARVTLTKSGSVAVLQAFLDAIKKAANSTDLYNVEAGSIQYTNVSIESYNYKRTATNGVSMLTVELVLLEIRQAPASKFTKTKKPNGADKVNGGTVQAQPVTQGPNMTAGAPTSDAAFQGGVAASQAIAAAASSLPAATVAAVMSAETPAVQATGPHYPVSPNGPNVGASGNILSSSQFAAGVSAFAISPISGLISQSTVTPSGTISVKLSIPPLKIQ